MTITEVVSSRLTESLYAIPKLLTGGNAWTPEFAAWEDKTARAIDDATGPGSRESQLFRSFAFWNLRRSKAAWNGGDQERYERELARTRALLEDILSVNGRPGQPVGGAWWDVIHPDIARIARDRFTAGQYADAVEAALKSINALVKQRFLQAGRGQVLDGAKLMQAAFSLGTPVIHLDADLSSESGKNIQQGYMQIFSGAMTGIRNPKAHDNITITEVRAVHLLFLASLLRYKLDDGATH